MICVISIRQNAGACDIYISHCCLHLAPWHPSRNQSTGLFDRDDDDDFPSRRISVPLCDNHRVMDRRYINLRTHLQYQPWPSNTTLRNVTLLSTVCGDFPMYPLRPDTSKSADRWKGWDSWWQETATASQSPPSHWDTVSFAHFMVQCCELGWNYPLLKRDHR